MNNEKQKLYLDMDGTLADFIGAVESHPDYETHKANDTLDKLDVFEHLVPMPNAIESVKQLIASDLYDVYILSTPPWDNPKAWMDKRLWIENYLPELKKKVILTHHKHLLCQSENDIIIDDRIKNGVEYWKGIHIHYGQPEAPTWDSIVSELLG